MDPPDLTSMLNPCIDYSVRVGDCDLRLITSNQSWNDSAEHLPGTRRPARTVTNAAFLVHLFLVGPSRRHSAMAEKVNQRCETTSLSE